jgi:hypothetical protein
VRFPTILSLTKKQVKTQTDQSINQSIKTMKLFTSIVLMLVPVVSTLAHEEPQAVDVTQRELAEVEQDIPLRQDEIEALFHKDMEDGVGIIIGEPDEEDNDSASVNEKDGSNLRGRRVLQSSSLTLLCKNSDCQNGHVWVSPGRYGSMPWQIGNDALTRVYIPAGHTFTYYEHTNFQGWQATFGEPQTRINLYMGGHNDAVSSFIIRRF